MYQLLAFIVLGGVSALAAAEPIPFAGNTPAEIDENGYGYTYDTASFGDISTGDTALPATPTTTSSYDTIVDPSIYSAPVIVSPSAETTLAGHPYTFLTVTDSVDPLSTGAGSPYTAVPDPTFPDTSSDEGAAYTYSFPPFIISTSVVIPLSTGSSSETAAPLSTGASSVTSLAPYRTETLGPYTNSSIAEPTQISSYGNPFTSGNSGIFTSPTNTIESTTYVTVSATSTLTSTLQSFNGSSAHPTAPISSYATYPASGLPSGTGTLGGITANSTSTSGVYTSKEPTYPFPSNTSSIIGTSPASGSSSLNSPLSTGTGISSSPSSGIGVSSTGLAPYPIPSNASSVIGTSPASGSSSLVGPLPTGTGVSSAPSASTVGSAISLSTYGPVIWPNTTSTSLAGPTAISSSYPTAPVYPTSDLSGSGTSSPIDTTCTEALTSTLSDGGDGTISDFLTTFVTAVSPSIYPSAPFNSTTQASPLTTSSPSLSTFPILTTAPVVVTSGDPVYSAVLTYPSVSVPVPTEYYYHHRRPHGGKERRPYFSHAGEDQDEGYGYGYDDGDDYDFGDDGAYE
ncbi:hypothetical protein G7Y79_00025g056790 [Physcia stellaris]|nr:hypothetical protein G7Y79_00025g056790 [Physcia stellaris]